MNIYLEKLFNRYSISKKNRYEISQIYNLLPPDKQSNLIRNFENLANSINVIEENLSIEREILIWNALDNIKDIIKIIRKEKSLKLLKWEIIQS